MKTLLALGLIFSLASGVCAQGPCPSPSPSPSPQPTPKDNGAADPAFMNNDPRPSQPAKVSPLREIQSAKLSDSDQKAWQAVYLQFEKAPAKSFSLVEKIWRENRSQEFQRMAILKARPLVLSTDEASDLDFMLACLDDPSAQRQECLALGKGNGLERDLGAKRLALLEANPQLREASN